MWTHTFPWVPCLNTPSTLQLSTYGAYAGCCVSLSSGALWIEAPARLPCLPILRPEPTGQGWRMGPWSWGRRVRHSEEREEGRTQSWVIRGKEYVCLEWVLVCSGGRGWVGRHRVSWTFLIHYRWASLQVALCLHAKHECVVMWQVGCVRVAPFCTCVCWGVVCRCIWCVVIAALSVNCYRLSWEGKRSSVSTHFVSALAKLNFSVFFLSGRFRAKRIIVVHSKKKPSCFVFGCFDML